MDRITVGDREFVRYIAEQEIEKSVDYVAAKINKEYQNDIPILVVTLNGAIIFAADLLKRLTIPCRVTCIRVSSYDGTESTMNAKSLIGLAEDLSGQRVLIIEDIVDTGNTYEYITEMLQKENVKDIKIATMTFKPEAYKKSLPVDFIGLSIPNKFIVGRGLDYNGLGRNLRDIYQVSN